MSTKIKNVFIFLAGAGVGALATYQYLKRIVKDELTDLKGLINEEFERDAVPDPNRGLAAEGEIT
jgi:hypothetical protein